MGRMMETFVLKLYFAVTTNTTEELGQQRLKKGRKANESLLSVDNDRLAKDTALELDMELEAQFLWRNLKIRVYSTAFSNRFR